MKTKKILSLLIIVAMVIAFWGCDDEITKIAVDNTEKNEDTTDENKNKTTENQEVVPVELTSKKEHLETKIGENFSILVDWESINISDASANSYPELKKVIEEFNKNAKTNAENVLADMSTWGKESVDSGFPGDSFSWESKITFCRTDEKIVSFCELIYSFTGGVHGNYWYDVTNFDTKTGKTVNLSDVLASTDKLTSILDDKIKEKYGEDAIFEDLETALAEYEIDNYVWTIDDTGVTFWFAPYEIGPYASGGMTALLEFEKYPKMFKPEYMVTKS